MLILKRLAVCALPYFLVTTKVYATNVGSQTLNSITVFATKDELPEIDVPAMVSVIDIENNPNLIAPMNIPDVFRNNSWIDFSTSIKNNGKTPTMRGFSGGAIGLFFDGVRQSFFSGHNSGMFISPSLLKQVEVVRGSSSALYGNGSLGGAIAFKTKDAADMLLAGKNFGASIEGNYQSVNNSYLIDSSVYGRSNNFDAILSLSWNQAGDIRLGDSTKIAADDKILSGLAKVTWLPNISNSLSFNTIFYNSDAYEPSNAERDHGKVSDYVDKHIITSTTSIGHDYINQDESFNSKTKLYYTYTKMTDKILTTDSSGASNDQAGDKLIHKFDTIGINWDGKNNINTNNTNFLTSLDYGAEYYTNAQNGIHSRHGSVGAIPDARDNYFGTYVQSKLNFLFPSVGSEIIFIPAVRFDYYNSRNSEDLKNDDFAISPKLALTYKPKKWSMVFANYSRAFKAPNLTEIYSRGTHFYIPGYGANTFIPSPNLKPEEADSFEIGFGFDLDNIMMQKDKFIIKASTYYTKSKNQIDIDVKFAQKTSQFINIDRATIYGAEIDMSYDNKYVIINANYSWVEGKNDKTSEYLTTITPQKFVLDAGFKFLDNKGIVGWRFIGALAHTKVNKPQEQLRPGYGVNDIYINIKDIFVDNLGLGFSIENIFDKSYEIVFADVKEKGRNFKLEIKYKW